MGKTPFCQWEKEQFKLNGKIQMPGGNVADDRATRDAGSHLRCYLVLQLPSHETHYGNAKQRRTVFRSEVGNSLINRSLDRVERVVGSAG